MAENVGNKWSALLNGAIDSDDTSLAYDGAVGTLPAVNFRIVVQDAEDDDTNREIMLVTAGTSSPLTVTRAQEGTTGVSHGDNSYVVHVLTAGGLATYLADQGLVTGATAYNNTTQAISASTNTACALNAEDVDTDGFHDNSTNNSRLTVPTGKGGTYLITGTVFGAASPGALVAWLRKNGSTSVRGSVSELRATAAAGVQVAAVADMAAGDYVELMCFITSAINIGDASLPEYQTTLRMFKVAGGSALNLTTTQIGTTSIGASFDSTAKTIYKRITLPRDGFLVSIEVAAKGQSAGGFQLNTFVYSDNAGTPLNVIASNGSPTRSGVQSAGTAHTHNLQSSVGVINATARFISSPMGTWLTAGTYWIGATWNGNAANDFQIAYSSGTGSDRTKASTDGPYDHSVGASSTGTNDFSIFANVLSATSVATTSGVATLLQSRKVVADTPDDDFDSSSLNSKWTVTDGSSGTVSLLAGSGAGLYDLGSRPGWLMMQVGTATNDSVDLRQDYTLPDGKCIVAYVTFALDQAAASANNEVFLGIAVNDNDTGPLAGATGQTMATVVDAEASGGLRVIGYDNTTALGETVASNNRVGGWFLRLDRVGLVYHSFASPDGTSWTYLDSKTMSTAANNVWLFGQCAATMSFRIVVGCAWFRQGTALAIDPWPL